MKWQERKLIMNGKVRVISTQSIQEIFDTTDEYDIETKKMYIPDYYVGIFARRLINETIKVTTNALNNNITDPAHIEKIVKQYFGIV